MSQYVVVEVDREANDFFDFFSSFFILKVTVFQFFRVPHSSLPPTPSVWTMTSAKRNGAGCAAHAGGWQTARTIPATRLRKLPTAAVGVVDFE
jgi:hypothetical protein